MMLNMMGCRVRVVTHLSSDGYRTVEVSACNYYYEASKLSLTQTQKVFCEVTSNLFLFLEMFLNSDYKPSAYFKAYNLTHPK